jgi:hypothetical protein
LPVVFPPPLPVPLPVALPVPFPVVDPPVVDPVLEPVVDPVVLLPPVVEPVVPPVVDPVVLVAPEDPPAEQAAVLFCQDLPAQSMFEDVVPPRNETERTMTAAMRTTMTEYSTDVAPRSFWDFLMRLSMPRVSGRAASLRMSPRHQRWSPVLRRDV